jgi:tetratricopeptide (TPR) repeat protein
MGPGSDIEPLMREAVRLEADGLWAPARDAYRRLLAAQPALPDSWYNLARLERRLGNPQGALACYRQALAHQIRDPEEVHLNCGVIYSEDLRQPHEAEAQLRAALQLNPSYLPALLNLENLHEDLGQREQARALCEQILVLAPGDTTALARLANLHRFMGPQDPLLARLRDALARPALHPAESAALGFALGRALDECGEHDGAFAAYGTANHYSRLAAGAAPPYSRMQHAAFIDRIIKAFPAATPASCASTVPGSVPPVFIVGMFRSGSTLLEQFLAGHPAVTAGGELPYLPRIVQSELAPFPARAAGMDAGALADIAQRYLQAARQDLPDGQLLTDKRPDNFLYVGLIKRLFPDARILWTTRQPLDNCLSVYFLHLDPAMAYAHDLQDIAHYWLEQRRLMAHWRDLHGSDILEVSYDALVRDPQAEVTRALRFIGLDWDEACLRARERGAAVRTASVWQVREPIYQRSSGRWQQYRRHIGKLAQTLGIDLASLP